MSSGDRTPSTAKIDRTPQVATGDRIQTIQGKIIGMDSNYKNGLVFSDGQTTGDAIYKRTQKFAKRQKHTKAEVKSLIGAALKQIVVGMFFRSKVSPSLTRQIL